MLICLHISSAFCIHDCLEDNEDFLCPEVKVLDLLLANNGGSLLLNLEDM